MNKLDSLFWTKFSTTFCNQTNPLLRFKPGCRKALSYSCVANRWGGNKREEEGNFQKIYKRGGGGDEVGQL